MTTRLPRPGPARPGRRRGRAGNVQRGEVDARDVLSGGRPTAAGGSAPGSSASSSPARQPSNVPHGFRDFQHFRDFASRYRDRMRELYPDLDMGFQGSAVTGRSADDGAPFDEGRVSDYDIAITGDSVNAAARDGGVPFRGDGVSTGPLDEADLERLGLDGIVGEASAEAGRDVHVMIFRTMDDAVGRKPTIRVWF
ncbi:hypothetical protein ACQPZX_31735 [Actinoplanes sp. CA-142083]|uniref:hypothetical protein n=1 Tax=Actinoplanes sp. CA-142083 TaxID=3239903 RepID=UPI003D8C0745